MYYREYMKTTLASFRDRVSRHSLLFILLLTATWAGAQDNPPALVAQEDDKSQPLAVRKVDVEVRILGSLAETRMTMVFFNAAQRQLAGDLYFPLPEGATVSGYALDINGAMVDGVVVEKDKARQVFEKEVRKGVDPGLVEWTRGNHFKTRVFPIPARGTRTIRVSYVSEILADPSGSRYTLPLQFKDKLEDFHLRVEVVKAETAPVVQKGGAMGLEFSKWRDSFVAEVTKQDTALVEDLAIQLPQTAKQRAWVEQSSDGNYYFYVADWPSDPRANLAPPATPKVVTLFWDASGSRGASDHQRELAWLKTYFGQFTKAKLKLNLLLIRNAASAPRTLTIKNGDASELLEMLARVDYDGGTQLGALTPVPDSDLYLLFTDGLGNFGRREPPPLDHPLYILTADTTADYAFLEYLAMQSGGSAFNLRRFNDEQVLAAMAKQPFSFLNASTDQAEGADLYPKIVRPLQGRFAVAGKLTAQQTRLAVQYGAGGKTLLKTEASISRADAVPGELLRRFWAQKKLADLLIFQKKNETEITDLGKQYGLVTPGTSLLVLERLDQYVEHKVMPPASLPALRAEYANLMEQRFTQARQQESQKIDHILALWNTRVAWWNKEFKYPENFKYGQPETLRTGLPGGARAMGGFSADAPHPTPDGAPMAQRRFNSARMVEESVSAADAPMSPAPAAAPRPARTSMALASDPHPGAKAKEDRLEEVNNPQPGILIKEWDPKTPYLEALKQADAGQRLTVYLAQRKKFSASPAFYLDCAEYLRKQKEADLALQVLSNIAELELENAALLRVLAHRLEQLGQLDLAAGLFEEVLKLRPEEPQSFRDLALVLARRGQANANRADYTRAMELLAKVVMNKWDRFDEIEVIALMELNAYWAEFIRKFPNDPAKFPVDERLQKLLDLDVRICMTWDADMTDIDLHVTEPSGEKAMYNHNLSTIGGIVSRDFTQGYGPEEYCLRKAMHGMYKIEANYYGSSAARLMGPVTVQATVITHFGRPNEQRKSLTLRLTEKQETVLVGEIEF